MSKSKRFQKTRIVDKWGGIYDAETDKILNINDVEHELNELVEENKELRSDEMMNEKQFYRASVCGDEGLYNQEGCIISNVRSNIDLDENWNIVVGLLNDLSANCSLLQEENENLIQKNCIPCELVKLQTREIDKLKEDNEQLKEEIINSHKAYVECLNQIKDLKKKVKRLQDIAKRTEEEKEEYADLYNEIMRKYKELDIR